MARFLPLTVTGIAPETRDAVVVTLAPRPEDAAAFAFVEGQYLTFRREFDGQEFRRSYSICAGLDDGALQVGIKRVDGGVFSTFANSELKVGDQLDAMPPMGNFHLPLQAEPRHYLGFAGGSGITPLLSILKTTLAREPQSRFTLVYANRQIGTIMFREALDDLKNQYLGRLSVIHVLEHDTQDIDLFTGRIDEAKVDALFDGWLSAADIDAAFICGPEPMMLAIARGLKSHGLTDAQIKFELFASGQTGRAAAPVASPTASSAEACEARVTLDGSTRLIQMPKQGQSLLEAALAANLDAPYACKAGVCSTCRARVLEGETEMRTNHALEDYEVRQGYVLTCQCYPLSDKVVVTYDE